MTFLNDFFGWFGDIFTDSSDDAVETGIGVHDSTDFVVNPQTGLPMVGGVGGFDVGGSPYGMDVHHIDFGCSTDSAFPTDSWLSPNWDD